jgi:hypothetical protein
MRKRERGKKGHIDAYNQVAAMNYEKKNMQKVIDIVGKEGFVFLLTKL